ncbi:KdsC family phosphatase [Botrimarina hoheduenensis]|uniref:3-deoxy-D-manno-octulosonate 8-phosphate phosphatase KdsC n=1 Tax=Botrimarina hoheduenensis TaxID=2528000 RepID=A0A5C5WBF9_9BACT|nr:HAD hydrolase family protein [Botrimarina hoheduenensis]TWT47351.1 3-deoxy-D-manno-octulosonate 8-phosphate phosphatase KdsC [Botrimarina hoheduenensis]
MMDESELPRRAAQVRLLLSDVDGVMTDGSLTFDVEGRELKTFNVRDGLGIKLWRRSAGEFGIITGRSSTIVTKRAEELSLSIVHQGVQDKLPIVRQIAANHGMDLAEVAYIGDDLPDLPVVSAVGFGVAVGDACPELLAAADHTTLLPGGRGAVRELIETLLRASGRWQLADAQGLAST